MLHHQLNLSFLSCLDFLQVSKFILDHGWVIFLFTTSFLLNWIHCCLHLWFASRYQRRSLVNVCAKIHRLIHWFLSNGHFKWTSIYLVNCCVYSNFFIPSRCMSHKLCLLSSGINIKRSWQRIVNQPWHLIKIIFKLLIAIKVDSSWLVQTWWRTVIGLKFLKDYIVSSL